MAWIAVSAASAGVGVVGKIFGAVKAAKAAKANQAIVDEQLGEAKADQNRSFLDTASAKDAIKVGQQNLEDERKNIAGRAAITGGSDEAKVAANTGATKAFQEGLSNLTARGTAFQEQAKMRKNAILGMQMGINNQKAESAANISDAAGDLMNSAVLVSGMSGSKPKGITLSPTGAGTAKSMIPPTPIAGIQTSGWAKKIMNKNSFANNNSLTNNE